MNCSVCVPVSVLSIRMEASIFLLWQLSSIYSTADWRMQNILPAIAYGGL